ncbi:hypothetical protein IC006_0847 [Sulfuracidifex tepidarius]|uniref:DUF927 domain-containing protein n=1 Tax=Sulfuracidifex tepidarius TaxID=1294262 RepID=A0A510DTM0_9CREN|nr:hypothetical protein [Sulfuracidifex tepidarius]BBG23562.1 hypothetical protein IC006_0847 [Sulfuracidifex tepidarius]
MSILESGSKNFPQGCVEVKVIDPDLSFTVCIESTGLRLAHNGKEVLMSYHDFENPAFLRLTLYEEFGYDPKDPINGKIAFFLQNSKDLNQLIRDSQKKEQYEVCIEFVNDICNDTYILANENGVFLEKKVFNKFNRDYEKVIKEISSIKVKKIENVKFNGIFNVDFDSKFVKITTDERIITGEVDEVATLTKTKYGLEQPEKFKFLLNSNYETVEGYYAVGPWFDGERLSIATESLYNPPWKKMDKYRLPQEVPADKKVEVLNRIIGTVNSFKDKGLVTWILSFGLVSNFAHYLRQKTGYFPHAITVGRQKTGKTTLTILNQYLYWGSNSLPPIKPKSEAQLRYSLSQSTLVTPIEEWTELSSESDPVREMLNLLHSSAQRFVLKKITTSNPDINGTFLSLSSVLADTNFTQEVDIASVDKILFIKLDRDEGIDLKEATQNNALLKNELKGDYHIHEVLHAIGLELMNMVSEKLKGFDFNKERSNLLDALISLGYNTWVEVFRKYGVKMTPSIECGFNEFPLPTLSLVESITEEDLDLLFEEFVNTKVRELNQVPTSDNDILKYGFFYNQNVDNQNVVTFTYSFLSEFRVWLTKVKGVKERPISRLISDINAKKSTIRLHGELKNVYKKNTISPILEPYES